MNINEYEPAEGWLEWNRKKANEAQISLGEAIAFSVAFIALPFLASIVSFLE